MGSAVRGTRVGSTGEVFVKVSGRLKNGIDIRPALRGSGIMRAAKRKAMRERAA